VGFERRIGQTYEKTGQSLKTISFKIKRGHSTPHGAMPCVGLSTHVEWPLSVLRRIVL